MLSRITRRGFLGSLAIGMGGTALAPVLSACGKSAPKAAPTGPIPEDVPAKPVPAKPKVPLTKPADWDAIAFNRMPDDLPPSGSVRLLYRVGINRWRGEESCQLMIEEIVRA